VSDQLYEGSWHADNVHLWPEFGARIRVVIKKFNHFDNVFRSCIRISCTFWDYSNFWRFFMTDGQETMSFQQKLQVGNQLIGTLLGLPTSAVSEVVSRLGYDWLWIDMEHAPLSLDHVQSILQCVDAACSALVRIPVNDETWIKRVLDLGADGIIVPQVKSRKEAEYAVRSAKYPPQGVRSAGLSRANRFGVEFAKSVQTANQSTAVVLQIEHKDGVQNAEEIVQVVGVDAIIIGPYDLSGSYGKLGQITDDEVVAAIASIREACVKHRMPCGIFAMNAEVGAKYIEQGFEIIAVGADIHFLWTAAEAALKTLKLASERVAST
jgi:2-keto-3-deoxy-L-rhamnonate aldolase RhmA